MIRILDFCFSLLGLLFGCPILVVLYIIGKLDTGAPIFFQRRIGKNKEEFTLVKFRTMDIQTKSVASHLADKSSITRFGAFLRKTKLDELPQLWNVLLGHMSLVGPRPNLPNQVELIEERTKLGVYDVRPGITGLAQINEVDMSTPKKLAQMDFEMIEHLTLFSYFKYIFLTVLGKGSGDRIK